MPRKKGVKAHDISPNVARSMFANMGTAISPKIFPFSTTRTKAGGVKKHSGRPKKRK